jgi:hypothetical protein
MPTIKTSNTNYLNHITSLNLSVVPSLPSTHTSAIADTGCTGHYITINCPHTHRHPANPSLAVRVPNGSVLRSSHVATLALPGFSPAACQAFFLGSLHIRSSPSVNCAMTAVRQPSWPPRVQCRLIIFVVHCFPEFDLHRRFVFFNNCYIVVLHFQLDIQTVRASQASSVKLGEPAGPGADPGRKGLCGNESSLSRIPNVVP